jgi:hypothetical protein
MIVGLLLYKSHDDRKCSSVRNTYSCVMYYGGGCLEDSGVSEDNINADAEEIDF